MKRPIIYKRGHPLSNKNGIVRKSRFVLYEKLKGLAGKCHWCFCELTWNILCADHIDSNTENNNPNNLVASCRGCNANRDDGTGHGRKKPKKCLKCKRLFIGISHHKQQLHCSKKCAQLNRIKRGTKTLHGTRSRYNYGCRCKKCKGANIKAWNKWYHQSKCIA